MRLKIIGSVLPILLVKTACLLALIGLIPFVYVVYIHWNSENFWWFIGCTSIGFATAILQVALLVKKIKVTQLFYICNYAVVTIAVTNIFHWLEINPTWLTILPMIICSSMFGCLFILFLSLFAPHHYLKRTG